MSDALAFLDEDQISTVNLDERIHDLEIYLGNAAIPAYNWQVLGDELFARQQFRREIQYIADYDEENALLITNDDFMSNVKLDNILGSFEYEGRTFHIANMN